MVGSSIDRIFQFGDSIADTGNYALLYPEQAASLHPPYGETFPGHPTGRYCDGRLIIDYTAELFGLHLLEPYISKACASFRSGVNFAVFGATAINNSVLLDRFGIRTRGIPDLLDQIGWFQTYLKSHCSSTADCRNKLRRSLFFFGEFGANDIVDGILSGLTPEQLQQEVVPCIVNATIEGIKKVLFSGATRLVVPGNIPIGCSPPLVVGAGSDQNGCNASVNRVVQHQNALLESALTNLRSEFPYASIAYLDYYNPLYYLHSSYGGFLLGFTNTTSPCCESCGNPDAPPRCRDPYRYLNWDDYHPTQHAYKVTFDSVKISILLAATA